MEGPLEIKPHRSSGRIRIEELGQIAERRGWTVVATYRDAGISGAKGRDKRPGLDAMLKDAGRLPVHIVMAWAIDRLGRSLIDLLRTIQAPASTSTLISSTSTRPRRRASCFSRSRERSQNSSGR